MDVQPYFPSIGWNYENNNDSSWCSSTMSCITTAAVATLVLKLSWPIIKTCYHNVCATREINKCHYSYSTDERNDLIFFAFLQAISVLSLSKSKQQEITDQIQEIWVILTLEEQNRVFGFINITDIKLQEFLKDIVFGAITIA